MIDIVVVSTRAPARPKQQPRYNVVLHDSPDHSYEYVIRMLQELFRLGPAQSFIVTEKVDTEGRAVCLTTTREHAELKVEQVHAYGKDDLIPRCKGSMSASAEPIE